MKTSLTMFEHRLRDWLLDLLHYQWHTLGVPSSAQRPRPYEVIDPEALLWCSLEFFLTQPRLQEQALAWQEKYADYILFPRLRKFARTQTDPRVTIWQTLGQRRKENLNLPPRHQPGRAESTCATALLRARDVLGSDARHFLLIYLLANQSGARLRSVAGWSGQTYQNIAKIAKRWEAANVVSLDRGFARLKNPAVWAELLGLPPSPSQPIVLLNWPRFFDACVTLLRYLAKANAKSLPEDGPVVTGLIRQAIEDAAASVESATPSQTVRDFATLLTLPEHTHRVV